METIGTPWMWAGFFAFVVVATAIDLTVINGRGATRVSAREALAWSALWIALALAFAGWLWWHLAGTAGPAVARQKTLEYLTGYLIEKSLSVDNIFVFLMLFTYFAIPAELQRRALMLGVLGAIVLRIVMILLGAWLVAQFHWILYAFGAFLLATGVKMLLFADKQPDLEANPIVRWLRGHLALTTGLHGERLWIVRDGARVFTPLFLVLVMIGVTDVVFAVDSIPAIFAITADPFIVMTSNIFAILGLRALYFLLADMAARFHLLSYGLAVVLMFVGTKMLVVDFFKIPVFVALGVVAAVLAASIGASLLWPHRAAEAAR
ncbi:MAG: TerC family protein [Burkholderiales bacterium]|nr:TerC family protein [Burkholderiales bacterium]